jgi:hypothetical protein
MNRAGLFIIFITTLYVPCFAQSNNSETLTITTYYPAPYGVYRNLRLHPSIEPTTGVDRGVMFYNNSSDSLEIYTNSGWVNLTGGGGGGGGYWAEDAATHYIHNTNSGGKTYITGPGDANGEILEVDGDMRVKDKNGSTLLYLTRLAGTDTTGISFGTWTGPQDRFHIGIIDSPPRFRIDDGTTDFLNVNNIGNVGIGTTSPSVKLDVNGVMRLAPGAAPAIPTAGSIYYDSAQDTPRYRDATAPAQWINFISEYGNVTIPAGQTTWVVNFRKTYVNPPIVIATPVGVMDDMVFVRNFRLTNTYVEFDMDVLLGNGTIEGTSHYPQEIQYVVVPR